VTRIVFLRPQAVNRTHLFDAARALIGADEPRGPALVVAQAAVEVGMETAIDFALQLRDVNDPLREWVVDDSIRSWSPANNKRVQRLWTALTGDTLTDAPSWAAYAEGIRWRHAFVHRAAAVPKEQAEGFVTAAEQLVAHMVGVLEKAFPPPPFVVPGE